MKLNSLIVRATAITMAAGILLPSVAMAQPQDGRETANRGFCASLMRDNVMQSKGKRDGTRTKFMEMRAERLTKLSERRETRGTKLEGIRQKADVRIGNIVSKIEGLAEGDTQLQAVREFQQAVTEAVAAKRLAHNAANQTFRDGVDAAAAERKAQVDAAIEANRKAVDLAEEKARTACGVDGADSAAIRTEFLTAFRTAQENLRTAVQNASKVGNSAEELKAVRKAAILKAQGDFRAAVITAKEKLKEALGTVGEDGSEE